jgi:hypothetical protein
MNQEFDYNDSQAPWWLEVNNWVEGKKVNIENILPSLNSDDRRIAQLCHLLKNLQENEEKTIQENDSLTRWLLQKRNSYLLNKKFIPLNKE